MNSTELIAEVRQLWLGPSTTELHTDDENILLHADRVLEDIVMPAVLEVFEEYMIAEDRVTPTSPKVQIPARAYNGKIRKLEWRNGTSSTHPVELKLINRNQATYYPQAGRPAAWYFEGDFVRLLGDASGLVDIAFAFKPSKLVVEDDYRVIQALGPGADEITLTQAVPSSWTVANTFDIQDQTRSGMPRYWDLAATIVAGTQITFASEIAGTSFGRRVPVVGDYVTLAGECARPMAPEQLHGTIAQGAISRIAQAQGDFGLLEASNGEFMRDLRQQTRNLDRRVDQPHILVNQNSRFRRWGNTGLGRARRRFF